MKKSKPTSETEFFKIDVKKCARCGKDHKAVRFMKFINPGGEYTHWAHCPFTDDPLLMKLPKPTLAKIVKSTIDGPYPDGLRIYGRQDETKVERNFGVVIGRRRCTMVGCRGLQLCVKWLDGRITWPCTKGLKNHRYGMQII